MHYKLMFPNEFISFADCRGKEVQLEIESVSIDPLKGADGKEQKKPVLRFKGKTKKLVLNKTNAKTVAKQHGTDTDNWIGKTITIYPTTCRAFGEESECVRVK